MSKIIPLTQGKETIVSDVDFEELAKHKWYHHKGYAARRLPDLEGGKIVLMHRVIVNTPKGMDTDHINGNKLDNRRENLRVCTESQNMANQKRRITNISGYKGVYWRKNRNKWQVRVYRNCKQYCLGCFSNIEEAARAYDKAAKELFGEFARTNF